MFWEEAQTRNRGFCRLSERPLRISKEHRVRPRLTRASLLMKYLVSSPFFLTPGSSIDDEILAVSSHS
jgi:hypothetical protein